MTSESASVKLVLLLEGLGPVPTEQSLLRLSLTALWNELCSVRY
jgi:hypothetical protein